MARTQGALAARRRAAHLGLFFAYLQRRGLGDLARLPWWEYLAALGWMRRRAPRSWVTAERVVDTLREFHATLARAGHLPVAWELERAAAILRGGRALRFLARLGWAAGEPRPARRVRELPSPPAADGLAALATERLVDRLAEARAATIPWREMAELCRRGADGVPHLRALLEPDRRGVATPLWAIVVLGQLRAAPASRQVAVWLGAAEGAVAEAAAEALVRIGAPALPALLATTRGHHGERLHGYAALGLVCSERAYRALRRGFARDPHLTDVLARALARHGRREAIPALHARSGRVGDRLRRELEGAIFLLVHGAPPRERFEDDWRLRYRPLPRLGGRFPYGFVGIAALAHRCLDERPRTSPAGLPRPLGAILGDVRLAPVVPLCRRCGGRRWRPTGVLVCGETALQVVSIQQAALARARAAGIDDVWTALDACDRREAALPRRAASGARTGIAIERATLYWLVTRGVVELATAERVLAGAAEELALAYGTLASGREAASRRNAGKRPSTRRPQKFS